MGLLGDSALGWAVPGVRDTLKGGGGGAAARGVGGVARGGGRTSAARVGSGWVDCARRVGLGTGGGVE